MDKKTAELAGDQEKSLTLETGNAAVPIAISCKSLEKGIFSRGAAAVTEDFCNRFSNLLEQLVKSRNRTKVSPYHSKNESVENQ